MSSPIMFSDASQSFDATYCSEAEAKLVATKSLSNSSVRLKTKTGLKKVNIARKIENDIYLHIKKKKILSHRQVCHFLGILKEIKPDNFDEFEFILKLKKQLHTIRHTFKDFASNYKKNKRYSSLSLTQEINLFKNMNSEKENLNETPIEESCGTDGLSQLILTNNNFESVDLEECICEGEFIFSNLLSNNISQDIIMSTESDVLGNTMKNRYESYRTATSDTESSNENTQSSLDKNVSIMVVNTNEFEPSIVPETDIATCSNKNKDAPEPEPANKPDIIEQIKDFKSNCMSLLTDFVRQKQSSNPDNVVFGNSAAEDHPNSNGNLKFNVTKQQQEINWKILASVIEDVKKININRPKK